MIQLSISEFGPHKQNKLSSPVSRILTNQKKEQNNY